MASEVNDFGLDHNFTKLIPDLGGGLDPDDAFSIIPYIKGMALFSMLENLVGGEEKFQPFIKAYFAQFAGKVVTSESFRDFFLGYFRNQASSDEAIASALDGPIAALDWERLFRAPGMPEVLPNCDSASAPLEAARALAARWTAANGDPSRLADFSAKDIDGWSSGKIMVFLDGLLDDSESGGGKLGAVACERMAEVYGLLNANCELRSRFLRMGLGARWAGAKDAAIDLATSQGRMKFTRPMYKALKAYDTALARETFAANRSVYHPICSKMVAKDLEV